MSSTPRHSFRRKLHLYALVTAGVAVALVFLGVGAHEVWMSRDALVRESEVQSDIIGANAAAALVFGDPAFAERVLATLENDPRVVGACVYDSSDEVFARYSRGDSSTTCPGIQPPGHRFDASRMRIFRGIDYDGAQVGTLVLELGLSELYRTLGRYAAFAAIAALLGMALAAVVADRLQQSLMAPVGELARVARRVKESRDYALRATRHSSDELGQLTDDFNDMLEHIETTESALRQQQKLEAIGTLASGVAHEVNNPLTFILGNLEWLQGELKKLTTDLDPDERAEILRAAAQAVDGSLRVREIVTGLNAFARRNEDRELAPVDLRSEVDASVRIAENKIRHVARLTLDDQGAPAVDAIEGQLSQVFLNLIINALHAMEGGDPATNGLRIRLHGLDGHAVVEVTDTGTGIEPAALDRVFDPFFTTKDVGKGTGLGLFMCRDIVTSLGGRLEVSTRVGQGTTFRVSLPPSHAHAVGSETPQSSPEASRGLRVLVVDDEVAIVDSLRRTLAEHDVRGATTGAQAVALCRKDRFDVILCDLMMPEVSGADLYLQLGEADPALQGRIVFMTGGAFTDEARAFADSVDNPVLRKPLQAEELKRTLAAVARAKQPATGETG